MYSSCAHCSVPCQHRAGALYSFCSSWYLTCSSSYAQADFSTASQQLLHLALRADQVRSPAHAMRTAAALQPSHAIAHSGVHAPNTHSSASAHTACTHWHPRAQHAHTRLELPRANASTLRRYSEPAAPAAQPCKVAAHHAFASRTPLCSQSPLCRKKYTSACITPSTRGRASARLPPLLCFGAGSRTRAR